MKNLGTLWKLIQQEPTGEVNFAHLHTRGVANMVSSATSICLDNPDQSLIVISDTANEHLTLDAFQLEQIVNRFLLLSPGAEPQPRGLQLNESEFLLPEQFLFLAAGEGMRFSLLATWEKEQNLAIFQQGIPVQLFWSFRDSTFQHIFDLLVTNTKANQDFIHFHKLGLSQRRASRHVNPTPEAYFLNYVSRTESNLVDIRNELDLVKAIVKVQDAVTRELDYERLIEILGGILLDTLKFQLGELLHAERTDSSLVQKALWSSRRSYSTPEGLTIHLESNLEERVLRNREVYHLSAMQTNPYVLNHRLVSLLGLQDALLIPLVLEKRRLGLLKLYYSDSLNLSPARQEWLLDLARIMSVSLDNAREHTHAFHLATKDGLTNIYNRRYFEEQFEQEMKRNRRYQKPLSLLMIDVDFFKNYNDLNGHLMGDKVLITVAHLIKESLRATDFIARYGGEEFIVLLLEADVERALMVAEKIRRRIENNGFENQENQPNGNLTVTVGVAQYDSAMNNLDDLIKQADDAMYEGKQAGKNCCVVHR